MLLYDPSMQNWFGQLSRMSSSAFGYNQHTSQTERTLRDAHEEEERNERNNGQLLIIRKRRLNVWNSCVSGIFGGSKSETSDTKANWSSCWLWVAEDRSLDESSSTASNQGCQCGQDRKLDAISKQINDNVGVVEVWKQHTTIVLKGKLLSNFLSQSNLVGVESNQRKHQGLNWEFWSEALPKD